MDRLLCAATFGELDCSYRADRLSSRCRDFLLLETLMTQDLAWVLIGCAKAISYGPCPDAAVFFAPSVTQLNGSLRWWILRHHRVAETCRDPLFGASVVSAAEGSVR